MPRGSGSRRRLVRHEDGPSGSPTMLPQPPTDAPFTTYPPSQTPSSSPAPGTSSRSRRSGRGVQHSRSHVVINVGDIVLAPVMLLQVMRPLAKEIKAILAAENDHTPSTSQTLTERIVTVPRLPNIEHERPCLVTDKGNNMLTMCPLATIGGLSLDAFDDLTKFFSAPIGERACSETELRGRPQLQSRPAWEHKDGRACYVIGVRFRMSVTHVRVPHSRPVVDQELNAFKIWVESRRQALMSLSPDARRLLVKSFGSKTPLLPALADPQAPMPMPTDRLHAFKLDPRCSIFVPSHATRRKFGLITNHDIEPASLSSGVGEEETAAPDAAGPQTRRLAVVQKRDAMISDAKENEMPGASPSVSPMWEISMNVVFASL